MASALGKTVWLLMTKHYDLCYIALTCHGSSFFKDFPFALFCKLFHKKLVIHQHNKGMANDIDKWPYRLLLPMVYKDAKVILLSWHLYPDIERVVKKENVMVCPNGIKVIQDSEFIVHNQEVKTDDTVEMDRKIPRLLFLSNLVESKGVIVLLDALKILSDKGYSFRCDFVGSETKEFSAMRFSEEVNKRGLTSIAFYEGQKYGNEKEKAYTLSDVFVLPSYDDCFPLVLLEAMAHKLPIVTTNEGGIADIVENGMNGLIAERCKADSLAVCLEKMIVDKVMRKRMGEAGWKILMDRFTEEKFEERMIGIINAIC